MLKLAEGEEIDWVLFTALPFGKPVCRIAKLGLDSVNWKARSRVVLDEFVLFVFVGEMNLKEVGAVVSPPETLTITVMLAVAKAGIPVESWHCTFHKYAPLAKDIVMFASWLDVGCVVWFAEKVPVALW